MTCTSARLSEPGERINLNVIAAMAELGVDLSKEFPKSMTDEVVRAADAVITMGCGDARPIYPGERYEDWEVDDPAEADLGRAADSRRHRRAREALLAQVVRPPARRSIDLALPSTFGEGERWSA